MNWRSACLRSWMNAVTPDNQNLQSSDSGAHNESLDAQSMMRYGANKKSMLLAYILWFFLGYLGVHRFYLGRIGSAVAILLITAISSVLVFVAVGALGYAVVAVWLFIDIFLIPGIVRRFNNELIDRLTS